MTNKPGIPVEIQMWNETLDFMNELSEFLGVPRDEVINCILMVGRKSYRAEMESVRRSISEMLDLPTMHDEKPDEDVSEWTMMSGKRGGK